PLGSAVSSWKLSRPRIDCVPSEPTRSSGSPPTNVSGEPLEMYVSWFAPAIVSTSGSTVAGHCRDVLESHARSSVSVTLDPSTVSATQRERDGVPALLDRDGRREIGRQTQRVRVRLVLLGEPGGGRRDERVVDRLPVAVLVAVVHRAAVENGDVPPSVVERAR